MGHGTGVRVVSERTVEITFQYRGTRCRERVHVTNSKTKAGLEPALQLKAAIDHAIDIGKFDYGQTFPESKRAREFAKNPGALVPMVELFNKWLEAKRPTINVEQWKDYSEYVRHTWLPFLGTRMVAEVDLELVQGWVNDQTVGIKRIRALLTPLRQALRHAVRPLGYLTANPLDGLEVIRPDEHTDEDKLPLDPFTPAEVKAICAHLHPAVANMIVFWVWSGLRFGEMAALQWRDIDFQRGAIYITKATRGTRVKGPKTRTSKREVKLQAPARAALERQREYSEAAGAEVWLNPFYHKHGGKYAKPMFFKWTEDKLLRKQFAPACEAAKVRPRTPRQCRHSYASWMLSSNEPRLWVSQQMGHSNMATTARIYAKWIDNPDVVPGANAVALIPWQ